METSIPAYVRRTKTDTAPYERKTASAAPKKKQVKKPKGGGKGGCK